MLREESPATFSVSIETEAAFLLFQLGLVDRVIVLFDDCIMLIRDVPHT